MIIKAMQTIYSIPDQLHTPEGFWNILTYRGVFYGSPYATDDLQWFDSLENWKAYFEHSTKTHEGNKNLYYVNICAYGFNNTQRKIENIAIYWAQSSRWTTFLESNPGVEQMYKFLIQCRTRNYGGTKVFTNIGPLTALLICGDLIEVGMLKMPTVDVWAKIIYDVKKGAIIGLQRLALLGDTYTKEEVVEVFSNLHDFIERNLTEEERTMMGYNMIMLEHALCKFSCVTKKRGTREAGTEKKRKRTKT